MASRLALFEKGKKREKSETNVVIPLPRWMSDPPRLRIGCLFVLDLSPVTSKFHLNPPFCVEFTAVDGWRWPGVVLEAVKPSSRKRINSDEERFEGSDVI